MAPAEKKTKRNFQFNLQFSFQPKCPLNNVIHRLSGLLPSLSNEKRLIKVKLKEK